MMVALNRIRIAIHPNGDVFDLSNLFRGGDIVKDATGVLDDRFGRYGIQPVTGATYIPVNPRSDEPEEVGGSLRIAAFNVLNYFTTLDSRGANNAAEFTRQRDKIFAALARIDADVVGLIEIENNGTALDDLVDGLNQFIGQPLYVALQTGVIGTDEIAVAFIYKSSSVTPMGDFAVLDAPAFVDPAGSGTPRNRPALAQTFMDNSSGGVVTAVVNHFKSKGSECGAGDDNPEQGNCNLTRTLAAQVLLDWLATDPTGSGGDNVLIIGDLNSYDNEQPIALITSAFVDLLRLFHGETAYTYVFDGQLGYLDYALASAGLVDEVTGATAWHINSDEPDLIDYDTTFKRDAQDAIFAPDQFRSSDHDPVIVGLSLTPNAFRL